MYRWLWLAALVASCKRSGDDCQRFFDKAGPVMREMMQKSGVEPKPDDPSKFLAACRKHVEEMRKDPVTKCVLDAKDQDAVRACFAMRMADFAAKSKITEATLQLNRIGKLAKTAFVTNGAYPAGKVGPTPAKPCCEQNGKCAPTPEWASSPVWKALDFQIEEPTMFRYSYDSSDGKTAVATAVGDLDCDGTEITYRLDLTSDAGPNAKLTEPPPNSD
jgi:hypothetical protein